MKPLFPSLQKFACDAPTALSIPYGTAEHLIMRTPKKVQRQMVVAPPGGLEPLTSEEISPNPPIFLFYASLMLLIDGGEGFRSLTGFLCEFACVSLIWLSINAIVFLKIGLNLREFSRRVNM